MMVQAFAANLFSRRRLLVSGAAAAAALGVVGSHHALAFTPRRSVHKEIIDSFPYAHISVYMIGL
jgi:hypothetical protein